MPSTLLKVGVVTPPSGSTPVGLVSTVPAICGPLICVSQVYLSNIFDLLELDVCQSILQVVVNNMSSGGIMAYCTFIEPNKPPSTETLKKLCYLENLSMRLQEEDRVPLYSGFYVYSVK